MRRIAKPFRNPRRRNVADPGRHVKPEIAIGVFHHPANASKVAIGLAGNRVEFASIEQRESKLPRCPNVIATPSDRQHIPDVQPIGRGKSSHPVSLQKCDLVAQVPEPDAICGISP